MGSVILQSVAGVTIELTNGNYLPLFITAACAYPVAIILIHLFAPRLHRVEESNLETTPMPRGVTALVFAVLGFAIAVPLSFVFQNKTDYRPYDMKTTVSMTYTDAMDALPADEKSLVKGVSVKEPQVPRDPVSKETRARPLTAAERTAITHSPLTTADFREYLNRKNLDITDLGVLIEFKRDLKPEELAGMRTAFSAPEIIAPYTPENDKDPKHPSPANIQVPFAVAGNVALTHVPKGFSFGEYMAAVLPPGNLYKSADRASLLPPLLWKPLAGIGIFALLGAMLHGLIFGSGRSIPSANP